MYMKTNSDVVWVLVIYLLLIKSELYRVSLKYTFFMTKEINENKSYPDKIVSNLSELLFTVQI